MVPVTAPGEALDHVQAASWRTGWAELMAGFVPGLSSLEETICRVAETVRDRAPDRVLELGGGPGILAERMAGRWPSAAITVLDLDPVLLALARATLPGSVRALDGDLTSPMWPAVTGDDHDLVSVVMTLHYLPDAQAASLYVNARRALAPGGVLLVADLMPDDGVASLMSALNPGAGEAAAELAWAQWWSAISREAALRPQFERRKTVFQGRPPAEFTAPVSWHVAAARAAGFAEAGIVWRCGRHAALAAVA